VRLFVALELPDHVRSTLERWRPRADALRPVPAEQLHVTLAFLGERGEQEAALVSELLPQAARPVRALALGGALILPLRRPRVLTVAIEDGDGSLGALQSAVAAALAEGIGWHSEYRRFLAHVTVARVRARGRGRAEADPLGAVGTALEPPPPVAPFAATALTLFRSRLGAGGSRYERVKTVAL
jgi:2'-5' RNA ligase